MKYLLKSFTIASILLSSCIINAQQDSSIGDSGYRDADGQLGSRNVSAPEDRDDVIRKPDLNREVKLGLSYTLTYKGVAQDIELSDEQNEKLMGLWIEVKTKLENEIGQFKANFSPRFSPEKQQELARRLTKKIEEIRQGELDRINDALLPQQIKRLKQIRFQILKRDSHGLQSMEEELQLSPDQVKQIRKTRTTLRETLVEFRKFAREERLTPNEFAEKVVEIRKQVEKDLLGILTPKQQETLEGLQGAPFSVQTGAIKNEEKQ